MNTREPTKSVAVVLFQFGGPDSLDAIEPFLINLFSDPDIIDFPLANIARPTMARLIARNRTQKVRQHYAAIGGKSPILELTLRQGRALQDALGKVPGLMPSVFVGMRYSNPTIEGVVATIACKSFDSVVLLPLFPQYSHTTTRSSLNEWNRQLTKINRDGLQVFTIPQFYDHPGYIEALVEKINEGLGHFPANAQTHMIFSAHGIPLNAIEAGDPYCRQIKETTRLVLKRGGWNYPHSLCYQSRAGPGRWTEPMLDKTIAEVRGQGYSHLLIVPVSFVTDHVETLYEINLESRQQATEMGVEQFEVMPALNDSPRFIEALRDLVLESIDSY